MRIVLVVIVGATLALLGQTRLADDQIGRVARGEGVVVQTEHGLRTAMPMPGFAYLVDPGNGAGQVMLIPGAARNLVLSDVPVRLADGTYRLKWKPNPAVIAVYIDGLRLSPDQYRLVRHDPNQLPELLEIPGTTAGSRIVCDYEIGTQPQM